MELIPGCKTCEQVIEKPESFSVNIGYDAALSPRRGEYVVCKEPLSDGNVQMFQNPTDGTF